jgi:hypothetical protein
VLRTGGDRQAEYGPRHLAHLLHRLAIRRT